MHMDLSTKAQISKFSWHVHAKMAHVIKHLRQWINECNMRCTNDQQLFTPPPPTYKAMTYILLWITPGVTTFWCKIKPLVNPISQINELI